jgi:hypothetical protein
MVDLPPPLVCGLMVLFSFTNLLISPSLLPIVPRTHTRFPSPLIRSSLISHFAFTSTVVTRRNPLTQRLVVRSPFPLPAGTPVDDSEFEFPPVVSSLQHLSASSCLGHFCDIRLYLSWMQVSDSNDPHDTKGFCSTVRSASCIRSHLL